MADNITLARPYARAVFAEAKAKRAMDTWSEVLAALGPIIQNEAVSQVIIDPRLSEKQLQSLLVDLTKSTAEAAVKKLGDAFDNFIHLLIDEKRLNILPAIAVLYHELRLAEEKVVEAEVISAFPLSDDHRQSIEKALEKRFNSKIQLKISKDESLIGGALIRAGSWVMDGSVKGKLAKLTESLMG